MNVNKYNFDKVVAKTKNKINPIYSGKEEPYVDLLAMIEKRLYKFHCNYNFNGRQTQEIIKIILLNINAIILKDTWNSFDFEKENYSICVDEIEKLFLPNKNSALMKRFNKSYDLDEPYFELIRKLLIRIYESIEKWTKELGDNAYFDFIKNFIPNQINEKNLINEYIVENKYLI